MMHKEIQIHHLILGDNYQRGEKCPLIIVHFSFIYFEVIMRCIYTQTYYIWLENFKFCYYKVAFIISMMFCALKPALFKILFKINIIIRPLFWLLFAGKIVHSFAFALLFQIPLVCFRYLQLKGEECFTSVVRLLMTLQTVTHQSPLSMGFSRQGH